MCQSGGYGRMVKEAESWAYDCPAVIKVKESIKVSYRRRLAYGAILLLS